MKMAPEPQVDAPPRPARGGRPGRPVPVSRPGYTGPIRPRIRRVLLREQAKEAALKFRLTRYAPVVARLLEQPGFLTPDSRRNEMLTFLREGLEDFAVSRTAVDWGIPVPFDPEHRIYVWLDALANYLTALGYAAQDDRLFRAFWPAARQLVGKDIARFHAIYWPALLAALGLEPPKQIWAHGWFHIDGEKISKSRGNGVDPVALASAYDQPPCPDR